MIHLRHLRCLMDFDDFATTNEDYFGFLSLRHTKEILLFKSTRITTLFGGCSNSNELIEL